MENPMRETPFLTMITWKHEKNMPKKEKDWVLLTPYLEFTLICNVYWEKVYNDKY